MANQDIKKVEVNSNLPQDFTILVKKRAASGVFILGLRRVIFQIILTGGNIILARILFPEIIGSFTIINIIISFFTVFTDLGLSQALVQKKDKPRISELRTVFTAHLALGVIVYLLIFLLAPILADFYQGQLGNSGGFYIRFLGISLLLYRLKSVSSFLLERELEFLKLSLGELVEILSIQVITVFLAIYGFGLESFIWGVVAGRFLGALMFFILSPWKVGLRFSTSAISRLLKFGLSLQTNTLLGVATAAIVPLYVGKYPGPGEYSGAQAVGYLSWAGGLALAAGSASEIVSRIVFPAISRFQDNKTLLKKGVELGIRLASFSSFPLIAIVAGLAKPLTLVVYTGKWKPGLPALYLLLAYSVFFVLWTVITSVFFGLGQSKIVRNVNLIWATVQWVFTIPLVSWLGFSGAALAQLIASLVILIPFTNLKRWVEISLWQQVVPYLVFSLAVGLGIFLVEINFPVSNFWELLIYGISALSSYFGLVYIFKRSVLMEDLRRMYLLVLGKV